MKTLFIIMLSVVMYISCTETPVGPEPIEEPVYASPEFNISGKVMTRDGKPVYGASAYLKKYKLNATTDNSGKFNITGKILAKTLADTIVDTLTDTVVVSLDISETDSIIITESPVTSGVIFELPPSYIIQRNISGSLAPDDTARVGKIEAVVYDEKIPDQKKHIELWHDKINEQFNSFAYFSADTGKTYILYVDIYDTASRFIGRSSNFEFTDKTGDINFKNPFIFNNATPTAEITADTVYMDSACTFHISAKDLHGNITKIIIKSNTIDTIIHCDTNSIMVDISMNVNKDPFIVSVNLIDSDNNITFTSNTFIPYKKIIPIAPYHIFNIIDTCNVIITSYDTCFARYAKFDYLVMYNNDSIIWTNNIDVAPGKSWMTDEQKYDSSKIFIASSSINISNLCKMDTCTYLCKYIYPYVYDNGINQIYNYNYRDTIQYLLKIK